MNIDHVTFCQIKEAYRAIKAKGLVEGEWKGWRVVDRRVTHIATSVAFDIFGNERLTVKQAPKPKVSKTEKKVLVTGTYEDVMCACGISFPRSRFLSYMALCPACRKGKLGEITTVCSVCGKNFKHSKFNPYIVKCEACR